MTADTVSAARPESPAREGVRASRAPVPARQLELEVEAAAELDDGLSFGEWFVALPLTPGEDEEDERRAA